MMSQFHYLVRFAGENRKITVNAKDDLPGEGKRIFQIDDDVKLHYKDPDWNDELVCVNDPNELPDRAVVHITLRHQIEVEVVTARDEHTDYLPTMEGVDTGKNTSIFSNSTCEDIPSTSSSTCSVLGPCNSASTIPCVNSSTPKRKRSGAIPSDYEWPVESIPNHIRAMCDKKEPLTDNQRSAIIAVVFDDLDSNYDKIYCDQQEYMMLANALLQKFPYLRKEIPEGQENIFSPQLVWKKRIQHYFKNHRRNCLRDREEFKEKANKRPKKDSAVLKATSEARKAWGLANFSPERPESEDDTSVKTHVQWLQRQARFAKQKREHDQIKLRSALTFADRRKDILLPMTLPDIKEKYPLLFESDQMFAEFESLSNKDLMKKFNKALDEYTPKLVKLKPLKGAKNKEPSYLIKARLMMISSKTEQDRADASRSAALLVIPYQLRESADLLLVEKEIYEVSPTPVIIYQPNDHTCNTFEVVAEGQTVGTVSSLTEAAGLLLATYFIFNIAYPKKLEVTLTFLQKVLLGHTDGVRIPSKITTLLAKIHMV